MMDKTTEIFEQLDRKVEALKSVYDEDLVIDAVQRWKNQSSLNSEEGETEK